MATLVSSRSDQELRERLCGYAAGHWVLIAPAGGLAAGTKVSLAAAEEFSSEALIVAINTEYSAVLHEARLRDQWHKEAGRSVAPVAGVQP